MSLTTSPSDPLNPLPSDAELPFRLKESTFRLYEPIIAQCLASWPEPVAFNPSPLRTTTVVARIRDALISLKRFRWTTVIDMEVFDGLVDKIVVAHGDQTVVLGPRIKRSAGYTYQHSLVRAETSGIRFEPDRWNLDDVHAVCRLLSRRLIAGPVFLRPPLSTAEITLLESSYDIAANNDSDKTTIL